MSDQESKLRRVRPTWDELLPLALDKAAFEDASAALEAGRYVRRLRIEAGLTQTQLASRIDVSQARISAIENGEGRDGPSYAVLKRIATACGAYWPLEAKRASTAAARTTGVFTAKAPPMLAATQTDDSTIQLAAERLSVGKRVVNRGTTRVRSYVVETPVEEQVSLHSEKVTVDRRPVTDGRAVTAADFGERVIEVTETSEEAVVGKTARVVEEISLYKEGMDRVETVHDTVRRQEVEIERESSVSRDAETERAPEGGIARSS